MPLAPLLADLAGVEAGGACSTLAAARHIDDQARQQVGPASVSAVDPSDSFVAAARERHLGRGAAGGGGGAPFRAHAFDAALAQLVVHFMRDPVAGLREMARVTCSGGVVAACVWDHAGGRGPLAAFWDAAHGSIRTSRTSRSWPSA